MSRTKPGSEMAKALLRGSALLGSLMPVLADPGCRADVVWTVKEDRVVLDCTGTGNVTSIDWTHDGSSVPATQIHAARLLLEVMIGEAKGLFDCLVQCGLKLGHRTSIRLDLAGSAVTIGFALLILFGIVLLIVVPLKGGVYIGQRFKCRKRAAQGEGAAAAGGGGDDDDDGDNIHGTALLQLPTAAV